MIAPLLIIKRVANRNALTGGILVARTAGPLKFGSSGGSTDRGALRGDYSMSLVGSCGGSSGKLGVGVETTVDLHRDSEV